MEMGIKSKEARKYIFNCLDDMMQVNRFSSNIFLNKNTMLSNPRNVFTANSYYLSD